MCAVGDLVLYANNARRHSDRQDRQDREVHRDLRIPTRCSSTATAAGSPAMAGWPRRSDSVRQGGDDPAQSHDRGGEACLCARRQPSCPARGLERGDAEDRDRRQPRRDHQRLHSTGAPVNEFRRRKRASRSPARSLRRQMDRRRRRAQATNAPFSRSAPARAACGAQTQPRRPGARSWTPARTYRLERRCDSLRRSDRGASCGRRDCSGLRSIWSG